MVVVWKTDVREKCRSTEQLSNGANMTRAAMSWARRVKKKRD
jgi:hypothetical protein